MSNLRILLLKMGSSWIWIPEKNTYIPFISIYKLLISLIFLNAAIETFQYGADVSVVIKRRGFL